MYINAEKFRLLLVCLVTDFKFVYLTKKIFFLFPQGGFIILFLPASAKYTKCTSNLTNVSVQKHVLLGGSLQRPCLPPSWTFVKSSEILWSELGKSGLIDLLIYWGTTKRAKLFSFIEVERWLSCMPFVSLRVVTGLDHRVAEVVNPRVFSLSTITRTKSAFSEVNQDTLCSYLLQSPTTVDNIYHNGCIDTVPNWAIQVDWEMTTEISVL